MKWTTKKPTRDHNGFYWIKYPEYEHPIVVQVIYGTVFAIGNSTIKDIDELSEYGIKWWSGPIKEPK